MTLADEVLAEVSQRPGQKAKQIADNLDIDKKIANQVLYGQLKGKVRQDKRYRWFPAVDVATHSPAKERVVVDQAPARQTILAKLCRYYLDCLAQSNDLGVSVFAASKYGDSDYVELPTFPGYSEEPLDPFSVDGADRVFRKIKSSRGRMELYLGYPVRLRRHRAASGWEGSFMEPVMLWACDTDSEDASLTDDYPFFNFKVLRAIGVAGEANHLEEAAALNDELGLDSQPGEGPDVDELVERLRAIRPEWDWKEPVDAHSMSIGKPLAEIDEQGIFNRAVLVPSERSPYTRGLETELKNLAQLEEDQLNNTALGYWLGLQAGTEPTSNFDELIEVVPLNTEQRAAVAGGLASPLSVVTGPPGTGKSQVVASLITNSIWTNTSTLFASKNNKAVDVVYDRVNGLAKFPSLLRLGSNDKNYALAEHLLSLLSTSNSPDDGEEYEITASRHQDLLKSKAEIDKKTELVRQARNRVDALDRKIAGYRDQWGEDLFKVASEIDTDKAKQLADQLGETTRRADQAGQSLPVKLVWRLISDTRLKQLTASWAAAQPMVSALGIKPQAEFVESDIPFLEEQITEFDTRIGIAVAIQEFKNALETLSSMPSLEELALQSVNLAERIAGNSETLWRQWVLMQPSRITTDDRRTLSNYSATLQAMLDSRGEDQKAARQIAGRYYRIFPRIRHLLPCWAVTSLSARGKVPFEPGFFDLVVIDEASQCDIASALPLLYRAKRAVIIGDPMQLKHISGITVDKDHRLQDKHGLGEDQAAWGYAVNSLFNLAVGICDSDSLIMLRDHHRSHAHIINFSNEFFYKGRLRVATSYDRLKRPSRSEPAVKWTNCSGQVRRPAAGGAVNQDEAVMLVNAIAELIERGYEGSIGAVTPFRAQANLVRRMLGEREDLTDKLTNAEFLVDTVHRFQGDEKDVMFFSPVVSQGISSGALGFLRSNGNLFNVAITRARSLLHVVGDKAAAFNSRVDYLSAFAEYASNLDAEEELAIQPEAATGREYPLVSHPERVSDWEQMFYTALYDEGIRTIPQYDVEQYTLDFAVFDGERKLNIEVDGERYHKDWTGELCRRDRLRNQRLIELGWDVKRFWVYQIRDERAKCVNWVAKWLQG